MNDDLVKEFHLREEEQENWRNLPYDGLLGSAPDWVPQPFQLNLESNRNLLLEIWGLSIDEAMNWINFFESASPESIENLDQELPFSPSFPSGYPFDAIHFYRVCTELAELRRASQLQPEKGLTLLSGPYAGKGYKNAKNLKVKKPNNLSILIKRTYSKLVKFNGNSPSWREVLMSLEQYDLPGDPILECINWDFEFIRWRNHKGLAKETSFGQFRNKITEEKKHFQGFGKT